MADGATTASSATATSAAADETKGRRHVRGGGGGRTCHILERPCHRDDVLIPELNAPFRCTASSDQVKPYGLALKYLECDDEDDQSLMLAVLAGQDLCVCRGHLDSVAVQTLKGLPDVLLVYSS
jgi:hypothetical protein